MPVAVQRRLASSSLENDQDEFFDMLSRYQGRRFDDQRCLLRSTVPQKQGSSEDSCANKENIELCG